MRRTQYTAPGATWIDTMMRGVENNTGKGLKIVGGVPLLITGILAHQIATHGPKMSPGSLEWEKYH